MLNNNIRNRHFTRDLETDIIMLQQYIVNFLHQLLFFCIFRRSEDRKGKKDIQNLDKEKGGGKYSHIIKINSSIIKWIYRRTMLTTIRLMNEENLETWDIKNRLSVMCALLVYCKSIKVLIFFPKSCLTNITRSQRALISGLRIVINFFISC